MTGSESEAGYESEANFRLVFNMAETDDEVDSATFKQETVAKLLQNAFKDEKTRINSDALELATEYLRIFVAEAAHRAAAQAQAASFDVVGIEHFEKILPQLLLDF
ncbi:centromere protein X-like [Saccoglossus kowalevskii]|uniref:Centromere protein X n=1 Tax=Saccoglossus kowalevskii TaxID=10224 RepID=A0ABM0H1C7_SACKO|nr:PREDICTED: centromere protein X-like [Saccoglossus kowalevskii]